MVVNDSWYQWSLFCHWWDQRKRWRQKHQPHSPTARIWAPSVTSLLSLAGVPTSAMWSRMTLTTTGRLWWKGGISCNRTLIFEVFLSSQLTTMRMDMVIGNNFTKMVHITLLRWCHFFLFHFILAPRLASWIKVLQLVRRLNLITKISWPGSTWNDLTWLAWSSTKDLCLFWFWSGSSVGCVRVPRMPGMEPAMVVIIIWLERLRP